MNEPLQVVVGRIERLTPEIKRFTLAPWHVPELPGFSAGSHVSIHIPVSQFVHRNAYSLISDPETRQHYQIAVRYAEDSRGGSRYLHDQIREGDLLNISPPVNFFPLDRLARKLLLIAGGIGITPFMAYGHELLREPVPFELHYAFRSREKAALARDIADRLGDHAHFYDASSAQRIDVAALLAEQPLGTHVYVCGPQRMIDCVRETAFDLGWPHSHVHWEQFTVQARGKPFMADLAQSGRSMEVPPDMSLLDVLERHGLRLPYLCRTGVCGRCETRLVGGIADHRDDCLSEEERAAQTKILPCVSRACSERLVLDL